MTNTQDFNISYRSLRKTEQKNSTSITLPHFMIEALDWNNKDTIKVTKHEDKIILERVHNTQLTYEGDKL